jgi:hypothetical protein
MSDWIMVNGARIERSYLRENISEAKTYSWEKRGWDMADDHGHCMICNIALSVGDVGYRSEAGWLCSYCFETFLLRDDSI